MITVVFLADEQNDSNLLSSDHKVISDVLEEELGSVEKRYPLNLGNSGAMSSDASTIGEPELSSVGLELRWNIVTPEQSPI